MEDAAMTLTRDELTRDVARAFAEHCRQRPWLDLSVDQTAKIMVDIAEPLIRADLRADALLNIRTQVLALDHPDYCPSWGGQPCICPIRDVLVMLDREQ
jgi:hypothetical protein